MPTPQEDEKQQEYISRCIKQVMDEGKAKDNKQAAAICYSMWKKHIGEKAQLSEFSLVVRSVGLNKKTGERYWKASTSDIFPDSYNDEMSIKLYDSFLNKIENGIEPPEEFRGEHWDGGMPYVSISHYGEHSIAGDTNKVYVDGAILKANGTFRDTPLGKACFEALCDDLYSKKNEDGDRVRVSIAFLDYSHKHKSNGFEFTRSNIYEVCPECMKERLEKNYPGKIFLDGLLVHFAMTRVPVNRRTLMEVEKSMTTQKEDAASIVGEELAEELEEKEQLVGKSEAIVVKSEPEPTVEQAVEQPIVEEKPDVFARLDSLEQTIKEAITSLKDVTSIKSEIVHESHPLDVAFSQLKSDFNSVVLMEGSTVERLQSFQESFNAFGETIRGLLSVPESKSTVSEDTTQKLLLDTIQKLSDKIDLIASQQRSTVVSVPSNAPPPRSINPASVQQIGQKKAVVSNDPNTPPALRALIDRSVGL